MNEKRAAASRKKAKRKYMKQQHTITFQSVCGFNFGITNVVFLHAIRSREKKRKFSVFYDIQSNDCVQRYQMHANAFFFAVEYLQ